MAFELRGYTLVLVTSCLRASCGRNFDKYFMKNVTVFTTMLEAFYVMQLFPTIMRRKLPPLVTANCAHVFQEIAVRCAAVLFHLF